MIQLRILALAILMLALLASYVTVEVKLPQPVVWIISPGSLIATQTPPDYGMQIDTVHSPQPATIEANGVYYGVIVFSAYMYFRRRR